MHFALLCNTNCQGRVTDEQVDITMIRNNIEKMPVSPQLTRKTKNRRYVLEDGYKGEDARTVVLPLIIETVLDDVLEVYEKYILR